MARKVTPLTNTQVKQAKPKEKEYSLNDGDGLSLRIRPSGSKSWFFTYLVPITKKRFKISFGSYPEVTLAQARKKRDEARALVADGIDPKVYKVTTETEELEAIENTFAKQSERWLELKKKNTLENTDFKCKQEQSMLSKCLSNKLDPLPLTDIKPISGHREFIFPADRKPKAHSNPQTANMALKRMGFEGRTTAHGCALLPVPL